MQSALIFCTLRKNASIKNETLFEISRHFRYFKIINGWWAKKPQFFSANNEMKIASRRKGVKVYHAFKNQDVKQYLLFSEKS